MTGFFSAPKAIPTAFLFFFAYFLGLTVFYFFMTVVGIFEGRKKAWENREEDFSFLYFSDFVLPVSIIIPAHNEELWIRDSLSSALNLNYPDFEIIVVDDRSTDGTFAILDDMLDLYEVDILYARHYKAGDARAMFKSRKHPKVTVLQKSSGGQKAGAMNAGLNVARNDFICHIDGDTVLEPNALLQVMAQVARSPHRTIGVGSYFGLVNGFKIRDGRILERSFSYSPILAYQNLEYIRAFFGNRMAWSRYNSMPIVAGGFGIWRKDLLYSLGGFSTEFTCEDIEFTFRAHEFIGSNPGKGYRILMLPYYVGWTEGPSNFRSLIIQRERWQRVTNETVWRYKHLLLNPRHGMFSFVIMPYFILYEVLGIVIELASLIFVVAGYLAGVLDIRVFAAFIALMALTQTINSLIALYSFVRTQRILKAKYILYMILLSFAEFFVYRWAISVGKLLGTVNFLRGVKKFSKYERAAR